MTRRRLDIVVPELLGVEPFTLHHLRDHLVRAAGKAEIVDIAAAQHRPQRAAHVAHGQAELGGLVAVDLDGDLRLVDLEVGIQEDEDAARMGLSQKRLGHIVQPLKGFGGADHELHRQPAAARAAATAGTPRPGRPRSRRASSGPAAAVRSRCACARPRA